MPAAIRFSIPVLVLICTTSNITHASIISTFEDLPLAPNSEWHGPDPDGTEIEGLFGPEIEGHFRTGATTFTNRYGVTYGNWSGFAYSNQIDTTTAGYLNQFSAYAGGASSGSNFGIAFGYDDLEPNFFDGTPFDSLNAAHLLQLPHFKIDEGYSIVGMEVTNTTYAALSMLQGDGFAKKFGGISGNDPDWFKLSAYGLDANGAALGITVEILLADYRFAENSLDYLLDEWTFFDLSALAGAHTLAFNVSSSDVGDYGLNTPGYFAVDDIVLAGTAAPVPEPASAALLAMGAASLYSRRLLRRRAAP